MRRKEGGEKKEGKRKVEKRRGGEAPTHLHTLFVLREPNRATTPPAQNKPGK
jgi:hypothetical protein